MLINEQLRKHQVSHLLLDDPTNIYYFTKLHFSTARLLLSSDKAILFVDSRYSEKAKKHFKGEVITAKDLDDSLKEFIQPDFKIAFLSNLVVVDRHQKWLNFDKGHFIPVPNFVTPLRAIKTKDEVDKIKEACVLAQEGYQYLLTKIEEGVTELDLAKELQVFFLENGADGLAFDPIIAFGDNSAIPHHSPTSRALKKGDLIQFDIGCKKDGYCSDMSRVYHFGQVHDELLKIEAIVMKAKHKAEEFAKPGASIKDFDKTARVVIEEAGYGDQFLHSLGHGVGLDIHEWPLIKQAKDQDVLEEGMIVTIEPGIYLTGIGGVRLEDTYLITKDGPINLTGEQSGC